MLSTISRSFIEEYAGEHGLKVKDADPKFGQRFGTPSTLTLSSFKKCIKCGRLMPVASEECEVCGTRQPKRESKPQRLWEKQ